MIAWIKNTFWQSTEGGQWICHNIVSWQCGAATARARLPTVDSLTGGTTRRLALVERSVFRPGKSSTYTHTRTVSSSVTVYSPTYLYPPALQTRVWLSATDLTQGVVTFSGCQDSAPKNWRCCACNLQILTNCCGFCKNSEHFFVGIKLLYMSISFTTLQ